MEKLDVASLDIENIEKEKLKSIFPQCFVEGKLNVDKLLNLCGEYIDNDYEKYEFTWKGKVESLKNAQTRSVGTLRPCVEESKNFDDTENLYIEGDNLEVLKLLQHSYYNKIKMIYIDPPYNTGNDFVYKDDFKDSIANYKEITGQATKSNPEYTGRFHTDWLNMIYPRLRLAYNLLTDDGVIFISIDDNEVHNLRKVCDEVFGEENFVATLHIELSATQGMKVKAAKEGNIVKNAEYILVYSKDGHKDIVKNILYDFRPNYDNHYSKYINDDMTLNNLSDVFSSQFPNEKIEKLSTMYATNETFRKFVEDNVDRICADDKVTGFNFDDFVVGKVYKVDRNSRNYYIINNGTKIRQLLILSNSFGFADDFNKSFGMIKIRGDWWKDFYKDMGNVSKEGDMTFLNGKKPVRLVKQIIKMCTSKSDIILDFFSGSATTAHAVMELNA